MPFLTITDAIALLPASMIDFLNESETDSMITNFVRLESQTAMLASEISKIEIPYNVADRDQRVVLPCVWILRKLANMAFGSTNEEFNKTVEADYERAILLLTQLSLSKKSTSTQTKSSMFQINNTVKGF